MNNKYLAHVEIMLKQIELRANESFGNLSETQLNWKPNLESWSIAECLEHLNISTKLYFKVFDDIKNNNIKKSFWTKLPFYKTILARMLLKAVNPDTIKKTKTSKAFQPTKSTFSANIITEFNQLQGQLIAYIHELDGYNHDEIVVTSPINKMVVYKLNDAFNILWKHQVRHFNQANNLKSLENFPKE